jgi:hypothetical protein
VEYDFLTAIAQAYSKSLAVQSEERTLNIPIAK